MYNFHPINCSGREFLIQAPFMYISDDNRQGQLHQLQATNTPLLRYLGSKEQGL